MAKSLQWSLESVGRKKRETKTKEDKDDPKLSTVFMDCNFTEAILNTEYASVHDMRLEYDFSSSGEWWFTLVHKGTTN